MTDADRERLILDNLSLAWWCVHRYFRCLPGTMPDTEDDLIQEARIGLIEAARTFDPDRGTRFATHAVWRIRGRVQNAIRRWKTTPVPYSPADPVFDSLVDEYPSALEMLIAAEKDAILTDALDHLPARQAGSARAAGRAACKCLKNSAHLLFRCPHPAMVCCRPWQKTLRMRSLTGPKLRSA